MTNTNYDSADLYSMIRFLAGLEWVAKSVPDFPGDPPGSIGTQSMEVPFEALRVPACPKVGKKPHWHHDVYFRATTPCNQGWFPEPDVERACWRVTEFMIQQDLHLMIYRKQLPTTVAMLQAACKWAEHQMEVRA